MRELDAVIQRSELLKSRNSSNRIMLRSLFQSEEERQIDSKVMIVIGNIVFGIAIVINRQVTIPADVGFGIRISAMTRISRILTIINLIATMVRMDMESGTIAATNDSKMIVDKTNINREINS